MALTHVDVPEAHRRQTAEGYAYIDVRSIPEYEAGHPAGAHNVPLLHADAQTGQKTPNPEFLAVMEGSYRREAKLLIGCQVWGRSTHAAQLLTSRGYQQVANVRGGFGGGPRRMAMSIPRIGLTVGDPAGIGSAVATKPANDTRRGVGGGDLMSQVPPRG